MRVLVPGYEGISTGVHGVLVPGYEGISTGVHGVLVPLGCYKHINYDVTKQSTSYYYVTNLLYYDVTKTSTGTLLTSLL